MSDITEIIEQLQGIIQENGYTADDRAYVRQIGDLVDSLVDQVNAMTDEQDQLGVRLSRVQKKQTEVPSLVLPPLNNYASPSVNNSQLIS